MKTCIDHDFAMWAFGDAWIEFLDDKEMAPLGLLNAWNSVHGDKMELTPDGEVLKDLAKMKEIWEKQKDTK